MLCEKQANNILSDTEYNLLSTHIIDIPYCFNVIAPIKVHVYMIAYMHNIPVLLTEDMCTHIGPIVHAFMITYCMRSHTCINQCTNIEHTPPSRYVRFKFNSPDINPLDKKTRTDTSKILYPYS